MSIDRQIIEQVLINVFGYDDIHCSDDLYWYAKTSKSTLLHTGLGLCDDWNFGGLIADKMRELEFNIVIKYVGEDELWLVYFWKSGSATDPVAEGISPLAICKAALVAVKDK